MSDQVIERLEDIPKEQRALFIECVKAARHVADCDLRQLHDRLIKRARNEATLKNKLDLVLEYAQQLDETGDAPGVGDDLRRLIADPS